MKTAASSNGKQLVLVVFCAFLAFISNAGMANAGSGQAADDAKASGSEARVPEKTERVPASGSLRYKPSRKSSAVIGPVTVGCFPIGGGCEICYPCQTVFGIELCDEPQKWCW